MNKKLTIGMYLDRLKSSLYLPEISSDSAKYPAQIALESYRYEKEKYRENLRLFANNVTKNWRYPKNDLGILKYVDSRFFTRVLTFFCFLFVIEKLNIKDMKRLDLDTKLRFIITDLIDEYLSNKKIKKKAYYALTNLEIVKLHDNFIANFWKNLILLDYIVLHQGGTVSLNKDATKHLFETFLAEVFKDYPTIIKPKDWDSNAENGGYYVNIRSFLKPNDEYAGNVVISPKLIKLINHLQSMPWCFDIPENYIDIEFKHNPKDLLETHKNTDIQQRLHTYLFLKDFIPKVHVIYYPYQIDFRGRIYPTPASFSPMSSKKMRAYLRTPEEYKLTEEAVSWLTLYLANVLLLNKSSYKETMQNLKNINNIEKYIEELPNTYQKYLSKKILSDIRGQSSNLLLQFDATSSVFQILSVLFNSKDLMFDTNVLGEYVNNLSPESSHQYKDIYQKVLDLAIETAPFEGLNLLLKREFVKPITMTFAYGATEYTGVENIMSYLEMIELEYKTSKGEFYKEEFNTFWSIPDDVLLKHSSPKMVAKYKNLLNSSKHDKAWEYRRRLYATIFHRHIIDIIYKTYPILEDFKKSFIEPGSEYQKATFKNPFLEFDNVYYKTKTYTVFENPYKKKNQPNNPANKVSREINLSFRDIIKDEIKESSLAAGANFVHSLDAFVLFYVIENKPKDCPIFTIHDCVLIRAVDVPLILNLIKEAFVEIQKMGQKHLFFSKYHKNGSIPIESYNIFKIEYGNE